MRNMCLILIAVAVMVTAQPLYAASQELSKNWLATGIVTRRDGDTIFMLADDNRIYRIDASESLVRLERLPERSVSFDVGDRIRVHGVQTAETEVKAGQILLFFRPEGEDREALPLPETAPPPADTPAPADPEPPAVIEPQPAAPAGVGAGPENDVDDEDLPQLMQPESIWTNRGFISGISFRDRSLILQTSRGTFSVEAAGAVVHDGRRQLPLSDLSIGDAVRIYGDVIGLSRIRAEQIILLRLRPDIEGQMPVRPTAMRGRILSIDYPSFTLRMETGTVPVNVLVDDSTRVTMQGRIMAFMDLRPGAMIKVDGLGAPGTGYVAQNIVIISMPTR